MMATGSALRERLPLMSHRPHTIASRPLIPVFGPNPVVWTTGIVQLPGDQAIELLAWMAQALIAATRPPVTPRRRQP